MSNQKTIELYESLKPGDELKYFYQVGNINNRTVHVRGRVDNVLVVRRWSKRKGWIYETMEYWSFQVPYSHGSLKVVKSKGVFNGEDQSGAPFMPKSIIIPALDPNEDDIERIILKNHGPEGKYNE